MFAPIANPNAPSATPNETCSAANNGALRRRNDSNARWTTYATPLTSQAASRQARACSVGKAKRMPTEAYPAPMSNAVRNHDLKFSVLMAGPVKLLGAFDAHND